MLIYSFRVIITKVYNVSRVCRGHKKNTNLIKRACKYYEEKYKMDPVKRTQEKKYFGA